MSEQRRRSKAPGLVLASTSPYRRALLERLAIPFTISAPMIDETRRAGELAVDLAHRLAREKAAAIVERFPDAIIVGSDQVAALGSEVLGKPGSVERCIEQLTRCSGRDVLFHTAVHVIDPHNRRHEATVDTTTVRFRELEPAEIRRYVDVDKPLDCAGGFKAEAAGIALFERIESLDPTALTGLPLIWLAGALRRAGIAVP